MGRLAAIGTRSGPVRCPAGPGMQQFAGDATMLSAVSAQPRPGHAFGRKRKPNLARFPQRP